MVRLVFRPYTQVRRSICTSEPLRPSTRVSPGFGLLRHSSPSFGSRQMRSDRPPLNACHAARTALRPAITAGIGPTLSLRLRVFKLPTTRAPGGLLGPCFKTGRSGNRPAKPREHPTAPTAARPAASPRARGKTALPRAATGERRPRAAEHPSDVALASIAPTGYNSQAAEATRVTFPPTLSSRAGHPDAARTRREVHRHAAAAATGRGSAGSPPPASARQRPQQRGS